MVWKVHTRNRSVSPPLESHGEFASEEEALDSACRDLAHDRLVTVLHIERPDGTRMELTEIERRLSMLEAKTRGQLPARGAGSPG